MTIRKRLFMSNILMIVIPTMLSGLLACISYLVLTGVLQWGGGHGFGSVNQIYVLMQQADELAKDYARGGDFDKLKKQVASFNYGRGDGVQLLVYEDGTPVYPEEGAGETEALRVLDEVDDGSLLIVGNTAAYAAAAGGYRLVLSHPAYTAEANDMGAAYGRYIAGTGGIMVLGVIGLILLTNLILTRRMYKSIMVPLNALVHGVHEIRDGNLEYRIAYEKKDEFGSVANDFNEMAGYLQEMVNARLRDNENRKELVAGISHDLRTPLTSIKAYLEGLESGVAATPEMQQKYFETIKSKTGDIEHIVSQLFLFSKLDVGEFPLVPEKTDLYRVVSTYVEAVSDEYRQKGLSVRLLETTVRPVVLADEVQLRNVLTNILENSVKYGGREDGRLDISLALQGSGVVLTLADNGKGVPPEALDRLFDVFYREDLSRNSPSKGSGLGLAISAKIIEGFGGAIRAENAAAGGLAVIITLPVQQEGDV